MAPPACGRVPPEKNCSPSQLALVLRPLRRVIPMIGVMDITPIVAYFALQLLQYLVETILLAALR